MADSLVGALAQRVLGTVRQSLTTDAELAAAESLAPALARAALNVLHGDDVAEAWTGVTAHVREAKVPGNVHAQCMNALRRTLRVSLDGLGARMDAELRALARSRPTA